MRYLLGCCAGISAGKGEDARDGGERGSLPDLGSC
jgi:hypothetical protein